MLAAISEGTWAFLGVLIANGVLLFSLFYRQGKAKASIEQINTAVNHQEEGAPTLVDRVIGIEERTTKIEAETSLHRAWEHRVFQAIAHHVGFPLPQREDLHE